MLTKNVPKLTTDTKLESLDNIRQDKYETKQTKTKQRQIIFKPQSITKNNSEKKLWQKQQQLTILKQKIYIGSPSKST